MAAGGLGCGAGTLGTLGTFFGTLGTCSRALGTSAGAASWMKMSEEAMGGVGSRMVSLLWESSSS